MAAEIDMPAIEWKLYPDSLHAWAALASTHFAKASVVPILSDYAWMAWVLPSIAGLLDHENSAKRQGFADTLADAQSACQAALRECIEAVGFTIKEKANERAD